MGNPWKTLVSEGPTLKCQFCRKPAPTRWQGKPACKLCAQTMKKVSK